MPRFSIEYKITVGAMFNGLIIIVVAIWAASASAEKATSDGMTNAKIASDLKFRIETLDVRSAVADSRTTVLETSIIYIRESLARIEANTTKKN